MSLLDAGPGYTPVTVTPPGGVEQDVSAVIQPEGAYSGTGMNTDGYESSETYRLRMPRGFKCELPAQTVVQWEQHRYVITGPAVHYQGSDRTRRVEYKMWRS